MPVFYEHSNIEKRDNWIRLLNKLHWLKMAVVLTFFAVAMWIFICKLSKYFYFISVIVYSFEKFYSFVYIWMRYRSYDGWDKHK